MTRLVLYLHIFLLIFLLNNASTSSVCEHLKDKCSGQFDWQDLLQLDLSAECQQPNAYDKFCIDSFVKLDPHYPSMDPNALMPTVVMLVAALNGKLICKRRNVLTVYIVKIIV